MDQTPSLKDKNVLVIGGGSGIGLGIAKGFAAEGCQVVIAGRTLAKLEAAVEGTAIKTHPCDAANRSQVAALHGWFLKEIGTLDILVYCAGINVPKRNFADVHPDDFDNVMKVNTTGAFNVLHTALPDMRKRGDGLIFNVVSLAGIQNVQLAGVPYAASKMAQTTLGTFANLEALPDGVRVTNVYPGETNTPLLDDRPVPPPAEKRAQMVTPEDVALMVVSIAKLPKHTYVPEIVITPTYMPRF